MTTGRIGIAQQSSLCCLLSRCPTVQLEPTNYRVRTTRHGQPASDRQVSCFARGGTVPRCRLRVAPRPGISQATEPRTVVSALCRASASIINSVSRAFATTRSRIRRWALASASELISLALQLGGESEDLYPRVLVTCNLPSTLR